MNIIQTFEAEQVAKLTADRPIPDFQPGETLRVAVKVVEGERSRLQNFEGVCIARSNKGMGSCFTSFELVRGAVQLMEPLLIGASVLDPSSSPRFGQTDTSGQPGLSSRPELVKRDHRGIPGTTRCRDHRPALSTPGRSRRADRRRRGRSQGI